MGERAGWDRERMTSWDLNLGRLLHVELLAIDSNDSPLFVNEKNLMFASHKQLVAHLMQHCTCNAEHLGTSSVKHGSRQPIKRSKTCRNMLKWHGCFKKICFYLTFASVNTVGWVKGRR